MTTVNEYFDKVFLLTLKESPYGKDKVKEATKKLNDAKIDFEIYYIL